MRIEELIRNNANQFGVIGSEYIIRVLNEKDGTLHIYIRPYDRNGDTGDFLVQDNLLFPIKYLK